MSLSGNGVLGCMSNRSLQPLSACMQQDGCRLQRRQVNAMLYMWVYQKAALRDSRQHLVLFALQAFAAAEMCYKRLAHGATPVKISAVDADSRSGCAACSTAGEVSAGAPEPDLDPQASTKHCDTDDRDYKATVLPVVTCKAQLYGMPQTV